MSTPTQPSFIESIRLKDGRFPLLAYHQERVDRARRRFFPDGKNLQLRSVLRDLDYPDQGLFKVRIVYSEALESVDVTPYERRRIDSLRLVDATGLDYTHKFADRSPIQELWRQREGADDVLMTQFGYIMDASYANVALNDGIHWYTPAWPLLRGVRRNQLLQDNQLHSKLIRVKDLLLFREIKLFNALIDWKEARPIPIARVRH